MEEALFDDPDRRLLRGPRSERDRSRHIYYVYGRTQAGRYALVVLLDLGRGQALPDGAGHDSEGAAAVRCMIMQRTRYPPHTEDVEKLAEFFNQVDTAELERLEEMADVPERELISVSLPAPLA